MFSAYQYVAANLLHTIFLLSDALELTEKDLIEEKSILKGLVKFGNKDVCDIMKSRVDIVAAEINTNFKDLLICFFLL